MATSQMYTDMRAIPCCRKSSCCCSLPTHNINKTQHTNVTLHDNITLHLRRTSVGDSCICFHEPPSTSFVGAKDRWFGMVWVVGVARSTSQSVGRNGRWMIIGSLVVLPYVHGQDIACIPKHIPNDTLCKQNKQEWFSSYRIVWKWTKHITGSKQWTSDAVIDMHQGCGDTQHDMYMVAKRCTVEHKQVGYNTGTAGRHQAPLKTTVSGVRETIAPKQGCVRRQNYDTGWYCMIHTSVGA